VKIFAGYIRMSGFAPLDFMSGGSASERATSPIQDQSDTQSATDANRGPCQ